MHPNCFSGWKGATQSHTEPHCKSQCPTAWKNGEHIGLHQQRCTWQKTNVVHDCREQTEHRSLVFPRQIFSLLFFSFLSLSHRCMRWRCEQGGKAHLMMCRCRIWPAAVSDSSPRQSHLLCPMTTNPPPPSSRLPLPTSLSFSCCPPPPLFFKLSSNFWQVTYSGGEPVAWACFWWGEC